MRDFFGDKVGCGVRVVIVVVLEGSMVRVMVGEVEGFESCIVFFL